MDISEDTIKQLKQRLIEININKIFEDYINGLSQGLLGYNYTPTPRLFPEPMISDKICLLPAS